MIKWIIWAVLKIGTYFLVDFPSTIWKHFLTLLTLALRVVFKSSEKQLIRKLRKLSSVRIVKNLVKYLLSGTFDFLLTQPIPNFLLDFLELLALKKKLSFVCNSTFCIDYLCDDFCHVANLHFR